MTDLYAVIGHPISHSKSPWIHGTFAEQTGEDLEYIAIQAALDGFEQTVADFFGNGGRGLNVTLPFKQQAFDLARRLTERAQLAGAVNTLYPDEQGRLTGDNTDGVGLVTDLCGNQQVDLEARQVLILGAGGAVRGVLGPILQQRPASVTIANRTLSKAQDLAALFANQGSVKACEFDALEGPFDVIINGTSASLAGSLPPLPAAVVAARTCAYDMMYSREVTVFSQWALEQGAKHVSDGLGMLVEQAAESFYLWRGVRPQTAPVIRALRSD